MYTHARTHRDTHRRAQKLPYYCCRHAWELWHKRQPNLMTHPLSHQEESCLAKWKPSNQLICLWAFENTCFCMMSQTVPALSVAFSFLFYFLYVAWTVVPQLISITSVCGDEDLTNINCICLRVCVCMYFSLSVGVWVCVWQTSVFSKQAATKSNWLLWSPTLLYSFKLSVSQVGLPLIFPAAQAVVLLLLQIKHLLIC